MFFNSKRAKGYQSDVAVSTMNSFWDNLNKPFFVNAPMKDVTDAAYRRFMAQMGKPDVVWSEFVSADGLYHTREIAKMPDLENPLMRDLQFSSIEHPVVAQIFSSKPEMIAYASELISHLGFDGVDINMGCPDRSVEKQGAGASLMKKPALAVELIKAAKEGTERAGRPIPVSVKTRIGYTKDTIDEWIPTLLSANPAALTVHLRTRKELSLVPAHWDLMERIVALRDSAGVGTLLLGNGDVHNLADAQQKVKDTGADGVMLGRAIFGNPWVFSTNTRENMPPSERLAALLVLAQFFEELTPPKHFNIFKKHIKAFVCGFDGAAEFRSLLMEAQDAKQLVQIAHDNQIPDFPS